MWLTPGRPGVDPDPDPDPKGRAQYDPNPDPNPDPRSTRGSGQILNTLGSAFGRNKLHHQPYYNISTKD
jgi:hypothetical protein